MTLNYQRQGQIHSQTAAGRPNYPIVLLHGLFGSLENLNGLAKALAEHLEVISIDLPNHGRSPHIKDFSYVTMAEQVVALMAQLGIAKFSALGHSMGGKVAMQLAISHGDKIDKLIVADIAPVVYAPKHNSVLAALKSLDLTQIDSRKTADLLLQPDITEPGIRSFILRSLIKTETGFGWRFNLNAIIKHYANINQGLVGDGHFNGPTLFIKGALSDYIQAQHRDAIVRYFPHSKAHIIPNAGHWLHSEKPEPFNRAVLGFLFR